MENQQYTTKVQYPHAQHLAAGIACLRAVDPECDPLQELRNMNGSGAYAMHYLKRLGALALRLNAGAHADAARSFATQVTKDLSDMLEGYRSHEAYELLVEPMASVSADEAQRHRALLCVLYPDQEEALRTPHFLSQVRNAALLLQSEQEVPQ